MDMDKILGPVKATTCTLDLGLKLGMDYINKVSVPILNQSLTQGMFPQLIKEAVIHLLLVSNLPFLGKLVERVIVGQLQVP